MTPVLYSNHVCKLCCSWWYNIVMLLRVRRWEGGRGPSATSEYHITHPWVYLVVCESECSCVYVCVCFLFAYSVHMSVGACPSFSDQCLPSQSKDLTWLISNCVLPMLEKKKQNILKSQYNHWTITCFRLCCLCSHLASCPSKWIWNKQHIPQACRPPSIH